VARPFRIQQEKARRPPLQFPNSGPALRLINESHRGDKSCEKKMLLHHDGAKTACF